MAVKEKITRRRVLDEITRDDRVSVVDVDAAVTGGTVTLTGTVPSFLSRRAAVEDAWAVPGVRTIRDRITVRHPPSVTVPTDREIETRARNRLDWDPNVDVTDLVVSVRNGDVTLEGTVDAYWKKLHAERQIQDLLGVISVENKLGVVPTDDISDKLIADDIVDSLDLNPLIDPEWIDVEVEDGHVMLSGSVASSSARNAAYDAALSTAGVRSVVNDIVVMV